MGEVVQYPADRAAHVGLTEQERAELGRLRRIAARAIDNEALEGVISAGLRDGCLAAGIASRLRAHLMAE